MSATETTLQTTAEPIHKGTCFLCGQGSDSNAEPCRECAETTDGIGFLADFAYGLSSRIKVLGAQLDIVKSLIKARVDKGQTEYANGYKVQHLSYQTTRFDAKMFEKDRPAEYKQYLRTTETDSLRIDPAPGFS